MEKFSKGIKGVNERVSYLKSKGIKDIPSKKIKDLDRQIKTLNNSNININIYRKA